MVRNISLCDLPSQPSAIAASRDRPRPAMLSPTIPAEETEDGRDPDLRTLCRDPLRPDVAGATGCVPLADRDARPAAGAEQDLRAQPQAGEGDGAARRL